MRYPQQALELAKERRSRNLVTVNFIRSPAKSGTIRQSRLAVACLINYDKFLSIGNPQRYSQLTIRVDPFAQFHPDWRGDPVNRWHRYEHQKMQLQALLKEGKISFTNMRG